MNTIKTMLLVFLFSMSSLALNARYNEREEGAAPAHNPSNATYRADCNEATSQTDLNINNVRARLLNGGDMWWDFDDGRYIVPNVPPGQTAVSSVFAGAVWLGGFDDGGNLKLAAQTYRSRGNDYWPGPLEPATGSVTEETCTRWDRHFTVYGEDIYQNISDYLGGDLNCDEVPEDLKKWPARGNPYFANYYGWELPNQPLAPFYDENGDGIYNPCDGDFPIIEVRGCEPGERNAASIADQMTFWIYNDNGGIHTQTTGDPIRMEVQVLAFAYATSDEVNDMTFYRHKLINRANSSIDSTFFSMWVDADLGCYTDDLIGCDTSRSLAVVYNSGTVDGAGGCAGGTPSYGEDVPLLGVDYFRGPLDELGNEIGMSSFTYYNNGGVGNPLPGTTDPNNAVEYFNYMTGTWRDGLPFTVGGNAYGGTQPIKYVFPDGPNNNNGWSMCTGGVTGADTRTLQTSGPFRLEPGALNELIIGVTWVPDVIYPCPDLGTLLTADDLAQALFDNCFKITDGPDAPDMDIVELDKELIIILSNDTLSSNNARLTYQEVDLQAPPSTADSVYLFEGYKVYQLSGPTVSVSELADPDKARLIFQVDLNNGVGKIFNWNPIPDPEAADVPVFTPELMVSGGDKGIQHSFKVTEDQFAEGDRKLINHKKYYFLAVAYAHNNYEDYDPTTRTGQKKAYLQGRRNIGSDGLSTPYIGIPRINAPEYEGIQLNAIYGDGPQITRYDGIGSGGHFLDLTDETKATILENGEADVLVYKDAAGPIDVKIIDPIRVKGGKYSLTIIDENLGNSQLDNQVRWLLTDEDGNQWFSDVTLDLTVEQAILDRGISVTVGQVREVGQQLVSPNGYVGASAEYSTDGAAWYSSVAPASFFNRVVDYIQTAPLQADADKDPDQVFRNILNGSWVPYTLCNWRQNGDPSTSGEPYPSYLTPAWINSFGNLVQSGNPLSDLNNVDIILTPDITKWSRAVVVETANVYHLAEGWTTIGNASQMAVRKSPSVGKDGQPDGDGDGMSWFPGYAIDVETGQRLNIFFGENSIYDGVQLPGDAIGADMLWNPSNNLFEDLNGNGFPDAFAEIKAGGQHFIYVTNTKYDECAALRTRLNGTAPQRVSALREVKWTSFPVLAEGESLNPIADRLIPTEVVFKLRVNNPYKVVATNDGRAHPNNGYPSYEFDLDAFAPATAQQAVAESALDLINVVPNPYYAYSAYETRRFDNIVKITNVPAECTITIYSLDGKFIRQYKRDENPGVVSGQIAEQIVTSVEWDLKNSKGIPIAPGVYLIHVNVPGVGERVIKWFGINRTFDAQDL